MAESKKDLLVTGSHENAIQSLLAAEKATRDSLVSAKQKKKLCKSSMGVL